VDSFVSGFDRSMVLQNAWTVARTWSRSSRVSGTALNAAEFNFGGLVGGSSRVASGSSSTAVTLGSLAWASGQRVGRAVGGAARRPVAPAGRGVPLPVGHTAPQVQRKGPGRGRPRGALWGPGRFGRPPPRISHVSLAFGPPAWFPAKTCLPQIPSLRRSLTP